MLILRAELEDKRIADVRLHEGRIAAIGRLNPADDEQVIDAAGGLLLPGLHDHHIHTAAVAAALTSVFCGPPHVNDPHAFAEALNVPGTGWLRATGYHESVAGMLHVDQLDGILPSRPLRVQHRSGRMWFFNSAALALLLDGTAPPPGLERDNGRFTGRLFDEDAWLKHALGGRPPCLAEVGAMLARTGVTGLTDMSPANDAFMADHFAAEQAREALPQRVVMAGRLGIGRQRSYPCLTIGPAKLHLHEAELPPYDEAVDFIRRAHAEGRAVAVHCATEVELVFTLSAIEQAGTLEGDRIEHASIAPDTAVADIARLKLAVVSQPHFIAERGDAYLRDVAERDQPVLYRLAAFRRAGVTLAAGSDAPFGGTDPWAAMAAAVSRRTRGGTLIGADEALTSEEALDLYLRDPADLRKRRRIEVGAAADLCLLDQPWREVRGDLGAARVRTTIIDGRIVFDGIDKTPI